MIIKYFLFFCVYFNFTFPAYITNDIGGGRTGDRIIGYIRSKKIAEEYNLPFYLSPFKYAEYFNFYYQEKHIGNRGPIKAIDNIKYLDPNSQCVYRCMVWLTASSIQHTNNDNITHFESINSNSNLKRLLKPCKEPTNLIKIPENYVSIAIHVRQPSGKLHDLYRYNFNDSLYSSQLFDITKVSLTLDAQKRYNDLLIKRGLNKKKMDEHFMYKFPPLQFYLNQLQCLIKELATEMVYIFIFTDHGNPSSLCKVFQEYLDSPQIQIKSRNFDNYEDFIIDDLLNMARFDYLIRSNSYFAQAAQLIGSFKKVIYPKKMNWYDNYLIVEEVGIDIN